jgi:hypothetical protein
MNIVGEGFPEEIINQVYNRQKAYGSGYSNAKSRTPQEILYLNANSSWCKLVSSTNIDDINSINNPAIKDLNLTGTELAKQFVLFNGTANEQGLSSRAGINLTGNLSGNNKAYGIGGTEFGIRPMMGIQSVSVSHENRGSLRQASVKLKAWNRTQFEIIDVLYLRLGFSVLLEWGHSMYFDEKYELKTGSDINNSLADDFLKGDLTYNAFLRKIQQNRLTSLGNYDAMFAKVKNFSWSFQKDGSYDITLDLISSGDVIESLKINALIEDAGGVNTKVVTGESDDDKPAENDNEIITYYASKHSIGQFFWFLRYQMDFARNFSTYPGQPLYKMFSFSDYNITPELQNETIANYNSKLENVNNLTLGLSSFLAELAADVLDLDFFRELPTLPIGIDKEMFKVYDTEGKIEKVWDMVRIAWDDKEGNDETYYIRLGTFLAYLQNYLMPKQLRNGADPKKEAEPILNFDYDQNTNLMYAHKWQVGVDPRICTVGRTIFMKSGLNPIQSWNSWKDVSFSSCCSPFIHSSYSDIAENTEYGNIMNIYVNMVFVLNKIDELKDDKGKVPLFDLLKAICDGINEGLGGLNSLEPIIDEVTNTVKIIDANPLPNRDEVLKRIKTFSGLDYKSLDLTTELVSFDLYGYKTDSTPESAPIYNGLGHASFIKDFSFATELTPEFATMITVGAAANGSVVGENQTALSKLNVGLYDRYKKEVLDIYELKRRQQEEEAKRQEELEKTENTIFELAERWSETLDEYFDWLEEISDFPPEIANSEPTLNVDEVDAYKGVLLNLIQYEEQLINNFKRQILLKKGLTPDDPKVQSRMATGTGFIPFNLSVTMDGLSGMKIYSKFIVDSSYLPSNYPNNVEFLIKGINHEIADNKWTTKLESFCISVGNFEGSPSSNPNGNSTGTTSAAGFIANNAFSPIGQCGAPISFPIPPASVTPPSLIQKTAMKKALDAVFTAGEGKGVCSKYTYNIATNYINSLNNKPIKNGIAVSGKGDAKAVSTRTYLQSLGYTSYKIGENFTKTGTINSIENFFKLAKFNIGDIVIYWANDGNQADSWVQYGHIQIYTEGTPGYGKWASDKKTNFGNSNFVYRSKPSECWNIYLLKAPSQITSGVVPAASTIIPGATSF